MKCCVHIARFFVTFHQYDVINPGTDALKVFQSISFFTHVVNRCHVSGCGANPVLERTESSSCTERVF